MVTGYDHILFLFGVICFLYKVKDIAIYVSLFAVGHSATMLVGHSTEHESRHTGFRFLSPLRPVIENSRL